jgi:L-iditol 2-dehydrogenase
MKSLRLIEPRTFRWDDEPTPEPGPGEVRIKVQKVGICGSDIHKYAHGRIGDVTLKSPLILGHEFAGIVDKPGPGVSGISEGQLVGVDPAVPCERCEHCYQGNPNFCTSLRFMGSWPDDGALREFLVHPADLLYPLDTQIFNSSDGVMLEPLGIALHTLSLGHIHPGDQVAVHGCGPIGLLVIQLIRNAGAAEIIAIDPLPHRRQAALTHGATTVLDVDGQQLEAIAEITRDRGVDKAFEAAGENDAVWDAIEACKPGGRVILIGIPTEDVTSFRASAARQKGLTLMLVRRMKHTYPRAISLVETGKIDLRSIVTHHFPFEETTAAFELVEKRDDQVIKAMVDVAQGT